MSLEDKITGTAKEVEGKLTGDKSREAEGKLERAKGEAKEAAGHLKDAARDLLDREPSTPEAERADEPTPPDRR